jgi:predicted ATPase
MTGTKSLAEVMHRFDGYMLCAATSLSHLWQYQSKRAEAGALLTPIYDWFTKGFDTVDLQEARALLDALA